MPTILRLRRSRVYVFLSYRRKDAAFAAQALRYALGSADRSLDAAGRSNLLELVRQALGRPADPSPFRPEPRPGR
jgi:hypothetical protein